MTYKPSGRKLALFIAGSTAFVTAGLLVPDISGFQRALTVSFFGSTLLLAGPALALARVTITDRTITLKQLPRERTYRFRDADVHWQRVPTGLTSLGWTLIVRDRREARRGISVPLALFDRRTIETLRAHLTAVTSSGAGRGAT